MMAIDAHSEQAEVNELLEAGGWTGE